MIHVRCRECGSPNVQVAMWVRPNAGYEVVDDFVDWDSAPNDGMFCDDCMERDLVDQDAEPDAFAQSEQRWKGARHVRP